MNEGKYAGLSTEDILAKAEEINFEPFSAIEAALGRLEKLEAAVALHGFDELPEPSDVRIEVRHTDGGIYKSYHYQGCLGVTEEMREEISGFDQDYSDEWYISQMVNIGFTGWRYPVGDLSE